MSMENYVPVGMRLAQFRSDNKERKILIKKEVTMNWEKEAALIKATILLDGVVVAEAHALVPALGDEKEFEKGETSAVGRALVDLGYAAEGDEATQSKSGKSEKSEKSEKKKGLGGLGKKTEKKEEESSDDDAEEASDDDAEESSDDDSDDSSDDDAEEGTEEEEAPKKEEKKSSGGPSKLSGVMAKYGLKKP